jgi:dTDP-4-dehydrorhamnose reductase
VNPHGKRIGELRILVTGASGLLGHKIRAIAQSYGHNVFGTYNVHPITGSGRKKVDLVDQSAVESVIAETEPDVVINTASLTDVDRCESEFEMALVINGKMPGALAKACSHSGSLMVQVSTDYVFDGERGNYEEGDTPNPINRYGRSKLEGELQVAANSRDYCIARTSALYGWGRNYRHDFATWMLDKWARSEEVRAVTDQYVSPTLNTNLARMLLEVAERRITGTIHLSGSSRNSRHEFAIMLARRFNFNQSLVVAVRSDSIGWVARRPRDSSLNVSKALQWLNNKPISIQAALEEFHAEATWR